MRTTIRLDDDVAAAAREIQRTEHVGFGQAVNLLARRGANRAAGRRERYVRPLPLRSLGGARVDIVNTEEALDILEGPERR